MVEETKILVYIKSESKTIQAADMDTVGHPFCTNTNSSDWENSSLGKGGRMIPQDHLILLDAATRAAEKLGLCLEVIDISEISFFQKRKMKSMVPRIEIGKEIMTGLPTSDDIVEQFQHSMMR